MSPALSFPFLRLKAVVFSFNAVLKFESHGYMKYPGYMLGKQ